MLQFLRRLLRREKAFGPGERVVFVSEGTTGVVRVAGDEYSHVVWDDEKELGGSRVANSQLRRFSAP